jgi:hypothetical protein
MPTQPKKAFLEPQSDAELECLFLLASALQARKQQGVKLAAALKPPQESTLLGGLQAFWKALRRPDRNRTAQR